MAKKPTYEELEQRVKELEKGPDEKAQFEDRLKIFSLAIDQSSEGIAVVDLDGNLEYLNASFAIMHGYSPEKLVGKNLSIFHLPEQLPSVDAANRQLKETENFNGEIWHIRRDGTEFPTLMHNSTIKNAEGKPIGMLGTIRDISDMKQAEAALRESEEKLSGIINSVTGHISMMDSEHNIIWTNDIAKELFGKDLVGKKCYTACHGYKKACEPCIVKKTFEDGKVHKHETEVIGADGNQMTFWCTSSVVARDSQGRPKMVAEVSRNITDRKQAEVALQNSQHMLETVLDSIPSAVFWKDRNSFYLGGNRKFLNTIGMNSSEEIIGKSDYELSWTKEQADSFRKYDRKIMESGIPEFDIMESHIKPDGTQAWIKTNKIPLRDTDGNIMGVLGSYEDITEHKEADDELERQRNLFKMILETTPDLLILKDRNFVYQAANSSFCKYVGKPMEEVIGKTDYDLFPEDEAEIYRRDDAEVMKSLKPLIQDEEATGVEGRQWFHVVKTPVFDNDNKLIGILSSVRDITDKKQAQEDLLASEERFREFVEGTDDLVARVDSKGKLAYVNETSRKVFGLSPEECIGLPAFDFIHPDDREKTKAALAEWVRERISSATFENRQVSQSGQVYYMQWAINLQFDKDGNPIAINSIARDLTKLKLAEEKLKHYATTQEVLVREVNHRVKNNLAAIIGMLGMEEEHAAEKERTYYLSFLQDLTARIRGLSTVHGLLSASEWQPLKLSLLCEQILKNSIHATAFSKNIKISITPSQIMMNSTQSHHLAMVINELATNSIKHRVTNRDNIRINIIIEQDGAKTTVQFKDNGLGFPEEIVKGDFSSSNIGFELIRGIVMKSLGGDVVFENDNGAVTTISFENEINIATKRDTV